jgi:hypothetical protein
MTQPKILCDTQILFQRLRRKGIKRPLYLWAFVELIKELKSNSGVVRDSDLAIWWPNISESTRYNILKSLENFKIISLDKDDSDKRQRTVIILIEYTDTLYKV